MGRRDLVRLEVPFGAIGAALVAAAFAFASTGIPSWIPPAASMRFGVPSPLTGMTRSFVALASGDIAAAFAWHPFGPLVFAACIAAPIIGAVSWVRGERLAATGLLRRRVLWVVVAAAFAAAWVR